MLVDGVLVQSIFGTSAAIPAAETKALRPMTNTLFFMMHLMLWKMANRFCVDTAGYLTR